MRDIMADQNESRGILHRAGVFLGFLDSPQQVRSTAVGAAIPPTRADVSLSVDTALGIASVYRAISILVTSVSQMELGVYRSGKEIDTPSLIKNPNVNDTQTGFIEETVFSLAAYGNAYWKLQRAAPGEVVSNIEVLDPTTVTYTKDENGRVTYHHGEQDLPSWRIKHLRLLRRPGQVEGLGPIQAARGELTAALRLRQFADEWFDTSGVPQGMLVSPDPVNPEDAAEISEAWKKFIKEHGVPVLGGGYNYNHLHVKPAEAQFLEVQQAVIVNIARLFGIPAMQLLAEMGGTSNTYLNLEQANIVFLQTTLSRYMNEVENGLSDLLPRGQKVQFKEEGLLRMDSRAKWEVIKIQSEVGYTNGNELREAEGKQPLPLPAAEASPPAPEEGGD